MPGTLLRWYSCTRTSQQCALSSVCSSLLDPGRLGEAEPFTFCAFACSSSMRTQFSAPPLRLKEIHEQISCVRSSGCECSQSCCATCWRRPMSSSRFNGQFDRRNCQERG